MGLPSEHAPLRQPHRSKVEVIHPPRTSLVVCMNERPTLPLLKPITEHKTHYSSSYKCVSRKPSQDLDYGWSGGAPWMNAIPFSSSEAGGASISVLLCLSLLPSQEIVPQDHKGLETQKPSPWSVGA